MILEKIRSRTNHIHLRLEQTSILSKLTEKSISLPEYLSILNKFYGFIKPIEDNLFSISDVDSFIPDLSQRRKTSLLESDIQKMSITGFLDPHYCSNLPKIDTVSRAFGYLYVIEGSTLGGKLISENVKRNLNSNVDLAISYFKSYGEKRGLMWKNFINYLNTSSFTAWEEEEIVDAAETTFLKLELWLNQ